VKLFSQTQPDSVRPKELKEVIIRAWQKKDISHSLGSDFISTDGKKIEAITLSATNANIALKTGRQLFSKIPGVFVYDMDGSGNQLNIATRGLDPHRSWEYNIRQNNVIINSDLYGYPASHYSPPVESFERIEIVRGTASLQYGAQFGGLVNYITKRPDTAKKIGFESLNTVGSFGLMSTFNSVGGTVGRFSYYGYMHMRRSNGYRDHSASEADAQFIHLGYKFSRKFSVQLEAGRSRYLHQIPGPLNDSMFYDNPRSSTRKRNYFSPDIYVPSITVDYSVSPNTRILFIASGVFGDRNSVQLDAFATVPDEIDPSTGDFKNRQVDIDKFNSKTAELRVRHKYLIGKFPATLNAGLLYVSNDLHRRQLGVGTTGDDYDLSLDGPFKRDLNFRSKNFAAFAENTFQLTPKWTVTPGVRFENGRSTMSGYLSYYPNDLPNSIPHNFQLFGISSQYELTRNSNLYGGISQSYRPVIFKDIIPASTFEQVDKNLKNAFGYNAELGARGMIKNLQYDVSIFAVNYKNRLGTLVLQDPGGAPYIYRTNVGNSLTKGVEMFVQYKFALSSKIFAGIYTSTAFMAARYTKGEVSIGNENKSIKGNYVESAPKWITRNGIDLLYEGLSLTILYSYTGESYSDAINTVTAPASGARGLTPGYGIWDFNASFRTNNVLTFRMGINNVFDEQYFTKRPTFYPGPGIWPSDGRNLYLTVGVKL
jgi:Fe(3+) dicitrate transport protein